MGRKANPHPVHITVTRHVDAQGRRCASSTPGARKVKERSESYYVYLTDPQTGKRKPYPLGTTDEGAAWVRLREILRTRAEADLGVDTRALEAARRPISEHVAEWIAAVRAGGAGPRSQQPPSAKQAGTLESNVRRLLELGGWKRLPDVTRQGILAALGRLMGEQGRSVQTRNHYLRHLRAFLAWCLREGRLRSDPSAGIALLDPDSDRRHHRRAPTAEELKALFDYLARPDCPAREGMSGPQRALGYQVCLATGLRAGELRSLSRESFDLEKATVTVRRAYDKRRRLAVQPLPAWLVAEMREHFAGGGGCWEAFPAVGPGQVLELDLAGAHVPWSLPGPDGEPLFFDFHALRHSYITELASQPDMDLKTLLELSRHSTPELTLKRYAKGKEDRKKAAAERLPRPGKES